MTGGGVVGCGDCAGSTANYGGALLFWNGVTANIYGGVIADNSTSGYGAAITFGDTCAGVNIYGGVFSNNVGAATQILLYRYSGSLTATVSGGVFDANPNTTTSATTVKTVEQVGTKYIVGNYIATDADDQLTGGIYTFCPTSAGNWYLANDVTLMVDYQPVNGVYLCLNGHAVARTPLRAAILPKRDLR